MKHLEISVNVLFIFTRVTVATPIYIVLNATF